MSKINHPSHGEPAHESLARIVDDAEREFPHSWVDHRFVENKSQMLGVVRDYARELMKGANPDLCLTDIQMHLLKMDLLRLAQAKVFGQEVGPRSIGFGTANSERLDFIGLLNMVNASRLECGDCLNRACPCRGADSPSGGPRKMEVVAPRQDFGAIRLRAQQRENEEELGKGQAQSETERE